MITDRNGIELRPGQRVRAHYRDREPTTAHVVAITESSTFANPGVWVIIHIEGSRVNDSLPNYLLEVLDEQPEGEASANDDPVFTRLMIALCLVALAIMLILAFPDGH